MTKDQDYLAHLEGMNYDWKAQEKIGDTIPKLDKVWNTSSMFDIHGIPTREEMGKEPFTLRIPDEIQKLLDVPYFKLFKDKFLTPEKMGKERCVPVLLNENGHRWNMTEDEFKLWLRLDEATIDILTQICPETAEVVRRLRSEAPKEKGKGKAALPSIATGPSYSSPDPYYQPCHDGVKVHNQQVYPDDPYVNSAVPNQTGNAAASFYLEAEGASSGAENEPLPDPTLPGGGHQVHTQQDDPADGYLNSAPLRQTSNYAAESSDLEAGTDFSDNNYKVQFELENTFMVGSQIISSAGAVSAKHGNSEMSPNAKGLWYFLVACIFGSLIFWFYGLLLWDRRQRRGIAARFVMGISYGATALALLTVTGLQLPDELMVPGTVGACILCLPAIIGYAMKY